MTVIGIDTIVAVPLLVGTHSAHSAVSEWWGRRQIALCGHSLAETYSVLTRLPGDIRLDPIDAARLIEQRFTSPLILSVGATESLPTTLARMGIAGGAVYDATIGLAAVEHGGVLAT